MQTWCSKMIPGRMITKIYSWYCPFVLLYWGNSYRFLCHYHRCHFNNFHFHYHLLRQVVCGMEKRQWTPSFLQPISHLYSNALRRSSQQNSVGLLLYLCDSALALVHIPIRLQNRQRACFSHRSYTYYLHCRVDCVYHWPHHKAIRQFKSLFRVP